MKKEGVGFKIMNTKEVDFSKYGEEDRINYMVGCGPTVLHVLKLDEGFRVDNVYYKIIKLFHESYFNTAYDTKEFGVEFYNFVDLISTYGMIPLELGHLAVDEIYDDIIDILEDELKNER